MMLQYMENGKVTDNTLLVLQRDIAMQVGHKVDVFHSEKHRGILIVPHGHELNPFNVIANIGY